MCVVGRGTGTDLKCYVWKTRRSKNVVWVCALSSDPHQQPCRGWSPSRASPVGYCREHLRVCSPPSTKVCPWAVWKKPLTLIHPLLLRKMAQASSEGEDNSPSATGSLYSPCLEVVAPRWCAIAALRGA